MYLLDTNVVTMLDPKRGQQAPAVVAWVRRNGSRIFLSVITVTELDMGVLKLKREGKTQRADEIARVVETILGHFEDRVLAIDIATARHAARLGAATYQQPVALPDILIAATAARHGLIVLTRNMKEFERLDVTARDPFVALPPDV